MGGVTTATLPAAVRSEVLATKERTRGACILSLYRKKCHPATCSCSCYGGTMMVLKSWKGGEDEKKLAHRASSRRKGLRFGHDAPSVPTLPSFHCHLITTGPPH